MGSLPQTIVGIACLTAAFLFGNYIRNNPNPDILAEQSVNESLPAAALAGVKKFVEPTLPAPGEGFGVAKTSTPESQTASPIVNQPGTESIAKQPFKSAAVEIDVPDFSELAASFQNTPLELNAAGRRMDFSTRPAQPLAPPLKHSTTNSTNELRPKQSSGTEYSGQFIAGQADMRGLHPEKIDPPQPMENYELKAWSSPFNREDFQPKLIDQASLRDSRQLDAQPAPSVRNSTAPTMPEFEKRPTLASRDDRPDRADNQIRSYYEPTAGSTGPRNRFSRSDFESRDTGSNVSPRPAMPTYSDSKSVVAKRPRLPFRLNEAGRNDLSRIQSRQEKVIGLETNRFSQHTTQTGETLQQLSTRYYGKPDFYLDIYLANQDLLRNPADIPPGIQLQIPLYE